MTTIYPVLLAGGSGTRLWPLSRKSYPKQFSKLVGDKTLFQQSALRLMSSDQIQFVKHTTLTNSDYRFMVVEQLQAIGADPGDILIEPEAKNTAPAILTASLSAYSKDPQAIIIVAPSDHVIPNLDDFHKSILIGLPHVKAGKIVTFGITPATPETGYGYLELSQDNFDDHGTSAVLKFVEKPNRTRAENMLEAGNYLWNSGIFLFKALDMIKAFEDHAPSTLKFASKAFDKASTDLGFLRLDPDPWAELENISIDYAIMEKAGNLVAVPFSSKWSDLGGWDAVWSETEKDPEGNVTSKNAHAIDCINTLLRSESVSQQIVGLGLDNIMAISMPDSVIVLHKDRAQDVKKAVDHLRENRITAS